MAESPYRALINWRLEASRSAQHVVPLLLEMFSPQSVVDVGCGLGAWLAEFVHHGVSDILGLDGTWIDANDLVIPAESFCAVDLASVVRLDRRYDIALSLEVGEHLPPTAADALVETLTEAAPIVIFSAAIPGQGGVQHVNEQPPSYWAAKFAARDFCAHDVLRPLIWEDDRIAYYYRQNVLVFVGSEASELHPGASVDRPMELVHPSVFRLPGRPLTLGGIARELPAALWRSASWRLRR